MEKLLEPSLLHVLIFITGSDTRSQPLKFELQNPPDRKALIKAFAPRLLEIQQVDLVSRDSLSVSLCSIMATKTNRFNDLEWWVIQKRFIYLAILSLVVLVAAGFSVFYVWKYGNPFSGPKTDSNVATGARFVSFEGDVRVIRADTRETIAASSQVQLYPGDTVQTQADGRARINMADGSTLLIRENSTVIVRDNTSADEGQKTNVRVAVDRGQINVRTEEQADGTNNVVETPKTQSKLASRTGASFAINESGSEDIRVSTGSLDTTTVKNGEKTTVRGGEYVAINPTGSVARREKLLDMPTPVGPRDLEKVYVGASGAATVPLRWQRPAQGSPAYYRVEVATSPFFVAAGKVIERDQLASTEFSASDLRPGNYFWRVRATAQSGQASDWSDSQKFIVMPKGTAEKVPINITQTEYVAGRIWLIRGNAPPGTTVRIVGRETLTSSDGSFQLQITAPEGAREVTVEAQDPQGNTNRYSLALSANAALQKK
jgi:hypothetical protein